MREWQFLGIRLLRRSFLLKNEASYERGGLGSTLFMIGCGIFAGGFAGASIAASPAWMVGLMVSGGLLGMILAIVFNGFSLLANDWPMECELEDELDTLRQEAEMVFHIITAICPNDDTVIFHIQKIAKLLWDDIPLKQEGIREWVGALSTAKRNGYRYLNCCLRLVVRGYIDPKIPGTAEEDHSRPRESFEQLLAQCSANQQESQR